MGRRVNGKGYCKRPPGWGTDHPGIGRCKRHGGSTPLYQERVKRLRAQAIAAEFGIPRHVDPYKALEEELDRSAGLVDFYTLQVQALEHAEMTGPVGGGQGAYPEYKPNVWIGLLNAEREHFRKVAKTCIDAGIATRRVEIAEQQGQLFAGALRSILQRLGVLDLPQTPQIVREEMLALTQNNTDAEA